MYVCMCIYVCICVHKFIYVYMYVDQLMNECDILGNENTNSVQKHKLHTVVISRGKPRVNTGMLKYMNELKSMTFN